MSRGIQLASLAQEGGTGWEGCEICRTSTHQQGQVGSTGAPLSLGRMVVVPSTVCRRRVSVLIYHTMKPVTMTVICHANVIIITNISKWNGTKERIKGSISRMADGEVAPDACRMYPRQGRRKLGVQPDHEVRGSGLAFKR